MIRLGWGMVWAAFFGLIACMIWEDRHSTAAPWLFGGILAFTAVGALIAMVGERNRVYGITRGKP